MYLHANIGLYVCRWVGRYAPVQAKGVQPSSGYMYVMQPTDQGGFKYVPKSCIFKMRNTSDSKGHHESHINYRSNYPIRFDWIASKNNELISACGLFDDFDSAPDHDVHACALRFRQRTTFIGEGVCGT